MLDDFRSQEIIWDYANKKIPGTIDLVSSDYNGRKIKVQVINENKVENISGATLNLYWRTSDGLFKGLDAFKRVSDSRGLFELEPTTGMISNVGTLDAQFHLVLSDQTTTTSLPFKINVHAGIDEMAMQSSNSFTALDEAIKKIADIDSLIGMSQNQYSNLDKKITSLDNKLNDDISTLSNKVNVTQEEKLSQLESEIESLKKKSSDLVKTGDLLTVATFNIWHSRINFESYKEFAMVNRLDIVGFQEFKNDAVDKVKIYNLNKVNYVGAKGDYGNAIQSNLSLAGLEEYELPTVPSGASRRILMKASVVFEGKKISVYNTHLDASSDDTARLAQLDFIKDIIAGDRVKYKILLGDFNVQDVAHYSRLGNLKSAQGLNGIYHETWNLSQGAWGTGSIDNVLVSPNIDFKKVWMHPNTIGSDHNPLLAELVLYD